MPERDIRVLIVDDSGLVRELIRAILDSEPDIVIAGEASDGVDAYEKVLALKPDIVTMDIEMPVLGGLEAIEKIMAAHPVPILVITAQTGVRTAFAAVSKGALDVIEKPDINIENVRTLIKKVRLLAQVDIVAHLANMKKRTSALPKPPVSRPKPVEQPQILAIASSTGGPQAIFKILSQLPATFPIPILITQHIANGFTQGMVDWLSGGTPLAVSVAANGERMLPGHVYVTPAEYDSKISGQTLTNVNQNHTNLYHPSCDTMLKSVAATYGGQAIGLILSGMGNDGVEGMRAIWATGGTTLAQDESSSVVFGMNRLAIERGCISKVLPLADIAQTLLRMAGLS